MEGGRRSKGPSQVRAQPIAPTSVRRATLLDVASAVRATELWGAPSVPDHPSRFGNPQGTKKPRRLRLPPAQKPKLNFKLCRARLGARCCCRPCVRGSSSQAPLRATVGLPSSPTHPHLMPLSSLLRSLIVSAGANSGTISLSRNGGRGCATVVVLLRWWCDRGPCRVVCST